MEQERIELKLPSRLWYIPATLAFVKRLAQQIGFGEERVDDIGLTVDEICGNAIEHGSETPHSGIDLIFISDANTFEILIRDKGIGQKNDWLTTKGLDQIYQARAPDRERGHGIYIATELADHLEIRSNSDGGTDVRVVFRL